MPGHARVKGPTTDTTAQFVEYLEANGIEIPRSRASVRIIGHQTASVRERTDAAGNVEITISHPPTGGRAQTYHQRFTSRERALKDLKQQIENEQRWARSAAAAAERTGKTSHARKAVPVSKMEASAGFAIHTDHQDVIEDNAKERFGTNYGDAKERAKRMKAGLVDAEGEITDEGWEQLNKDMGVLEDNALAWLRKIFGRASDQGHDSQGDLIGGLSFDPRSPVHAYNIVMGKDERIDFSDASYGDFARSGNAWKGVSTFGQELLGGQISFFDIQPPEAFEIAEETNDNRPKRR